MSTSYKVVTKVNVTLQIEVQRFGGSHAMDDIDRIASKAIEIIKRMVEQCNCGHNIAICGDPSVFSILVKDLKP